MFFGLTIARAVRDRLLVSILPEINPAREAWLRSLVSAL
jgi:hypothetical protein